MTSPALVEPDPAAGRRLLDNPIWAALTGPHAHLADRRGRAARYPVDVAPFHAVSDVDDPAAWADLAGLVGAGGEIALSGLTVVPDGWEVLTRGAGAQLVDDGVITEPAAGAVRLGPADVPEMLDLVARTRPGPFRPRTVELGTYLGFRADGRLVAMAGERLRLPGYTEISAVCTDGAFRGRGLATALVRAVAHGIRLRGETPIMHAAAGNVNAIRLYRSLGFALRRTVEFAALRVPGEAP